MAKNRGMSASREDQLFLALDGIYNELEQNISDAKAAIISEMRTVPASKSIDGELVARVNEQVAACKALATEVKYNLQQNQAVHTDISEIIKEELSSRFGTAESNAALSQQIQAAFADLQARIAALNFDEAADKIISSLPAEQDEDAFDYDKLNESISAMVKTAVADQAQQILDAIAAIPVAENVDYTRIAEEVSDAVQDQNVSGGAAEIDYDKLSDMIVAKMPAPAIDYDLLADKVAEKMAQKETNTEVFIDEDGVQTIADTIVNNVSENLKVDAAIDYDRVCQAAQAAQIVPEPIDYDRIVDVLLDRLSVETFTFEEVVEEPAQEEAVAEAATEAVVEEPAEEVVEEVVEEAPVEEAPAAQDEIAAAEAVAEEPAAPVAPVIGLVEADGDLVVRLKRSFIAKLKQSEDGIKEYYSVLKNALTEYKRINSNISWHGDRFNFGRDTVARITIIGKTLGLYLALDPADPEFKQTVYRQKDVSKQKAYDGTPFMVKVKSDGGLKKALRLVVALAEKLGTDKEETFEVVDYVAMYPNATDEEMLAEGLIKATKEKKVDLDF